MKKVLSKFYYKVLIKGLFWFYLFLLSGVMIFLFIFLMVDINGSSLWLYLWKGY